MAEKKSHSKQKREHVRKRKAGQPAGLHLIHARRACALVFGFPVCST